MNQDGTPTKPPKGLPYSGMAASASTSGMANSAGTSGMAASVSVSDSRRSHLSGTAQTATKSQSKASTLPPKDTKLHPRRDRIANVIKPYEEKLHYSQALRVLGLLGKFNEFSGSYPDLFKTLAERAPAYVNHTMVSTVRRVSMTKRESAYIGKTNERAVVAYFKALINSMSEEVDEHNQKFGGSGSSSSSRYRSAKAAKARIPTCDYLFQDYQSKAIADSLGHKADLVFFYPNVVEKIGSVHIIVEAKRDELGDDIGVETFKQIADYQTSVWAAQPTRVFVPVLLLCGSAVTLVVFTRNLWYRADLGPICHTGVDVLRPNFSTVRTTMMQLYFLLTLSPKEFGHFCDIFAAPTYLTFQRKDAESADTTIAVAKKSGEDSIKLVNHMARPVHPRHRLAHVYDVKYRDKVAVLKLSWTPLTSTPESAIYELLKYAGVDCIPTVHACGLLEKDRFGYRLEYLVLEHCGTPIDRYMESNFEAGSADPLLFKVANVVKSVIRCLTQARVRAGILHRDISLGNVMVAMDGTVKVIDWGYGKVLHDSELSSETVELRKTVAAKWGYQDDSAPTHSRDMHNPLTGTPLYMSIPVLTGANIRGIVDDIEGLFYVVLHAISIRESSSSYVARGFGYHDNDTLALVRTGCLARETRFLQLFGITQVSGELRNLLCKLREYLFVANGEYIAPDLLVDPETLRGTNLELLRSYVDECTFKLLQGNESSDDIVVSEPAAATSPASSPSSGVGTATQAIDELHVSSVAENADNSARKKRKIGD
ncbi:hypothetical protein GGI20_002909 [Coemansia sp. BCRC 34301]|nr:hypothetical protein GGI20_002909 [Coemansia sp. BCRC 34301]